MSLICLRCHCALRACGCFAPVPGSLIVDGLEVSNG